MYQTWGSRCHRMLTTVGALLYIVFLVTAPFEHHDLLCHLKNPRHCTSCTGSQLGSDPQSLTAPIVSHLTDLGRAMVTQRLEAGAMLAARSTGRSPPSHS